MKRILLPACGTVLATGLLAAGLAGTAQARADVTVDPMARTTQQAAATASFWTAANGAALRAATSYTWDAKDVRKLVSRGVSTPDGEPGGSAPVREEKQPLGKIQNVNLPRTIGKVFFVDGSGRQRWCSATSVQSNYRNLVATAAHCVYDAGTDRSPLANWIFVPGYYEGKAPFGIYVGKQAFTHEDFTLYGDFDRDYAFVTVYNGIAFDGAEQVTREEYDSSAGPKETWGGHYHLLRSKDAGRLGDSAGSQGVAWNQPPSRSVRAFGYPAAPQPDGDRPYSGLSPRSCQGRTSSRAVGAPWLKVQQHIALKCGVTPGFDGGPWLAGYSGATRLGTVTGVTSTFADQNGDDRIDHITSPYFNGETASVYDAAKNVWSGRIVGPEGDLYR